MRANNWVMIYVILKTKATAINYNICILYLFAFIVCWQPTFYFDYFGCMNTAPFKSHNPLVKNYFFSECISVSRLTKTFATWVYLGGF